MRFRRHRAALFGAAVFCIIALACFIGPPLCTALTGLTIDSLDVPAFMPILPPIIGWERTTSVGMSCFGSSMVAKLHWASGSYPLFSG